MFLKQGTRVLVIFGLFFVGAAPVGQLLATNTSASDVVAFASATTSGAVDVTWTNATANPQPTGYLVVPLKNDIEQSSLVVQFARNGLNQSTRTVTGLTDGTAYTFRVDAVYLTGSPVKSAPSASATPYDVPAAPTLVATSGNGKVALTWTSVDNMGSSVSAYIVAVTPSPATAPADITGSSTTTEVSGLSNGTKYSFTLKARNLRGDSSASAPVSSTPVGPPNTMVAPTVTAGDAAATVSWTPPTDTGGSEIVSYTVTGTSSTAGATTPVSKSVTVASLAGILSTQVTGLTNTKVYTFSVTATNGGPQTSAASPSSLSVTPSNAPPAAISAVSPKYSAVSGGETVSFSGSNLTGSTVTATCSDLSAPTVTSPTVSATLVTVASPPCSLGLAQLTLSNGGNVVKTHDLTYVAVPIIISLSPTSVTSTGSQTVTLTGANLTTGISSETLLRIGGASVTTSSVTSTSIVFTAPSLINGATLGSRNVQVVLGSASGTLSVSTSITYTAATNPVAFSEISSKRFGSSPFTVAASATAGAVVFSSLTTGVCTINGASVTIIAAGNCRISGTAPGNTIYAVGTGEKLIVVERGSQTLTLEPLSAITAGASSTISATNSAGVSGGSNSFESSTPTVCSVATTGKVLGISSGDCIIVVTASETDNYSSTSATTTFAVTSEVSVKQPTTSTAVPPSVDAPSSNNGGGGTQVPEPASTPSVSPSLSRSDSPVSTSRSIPTLKKGKTISPKSIAKNAGLTVASGSKVVLSISASSKRICAVVSSSAGVRGIKAGSCRITMKITPKATSKVKKPKVITKTLSIRIS